jgi:hypothetical protein
MSKKNAEVEEKVAAAAKEVKGKLVLSCKNALKLADELGVAPKVVGGICNARGIKIQGCQLGCF